MIITPKCIYIHMHKCGGNTITTHLREHYDGVPSWQFPGPSWRHDSLHAKPQDKLVIGSIRNPYSYYVSRWKFIADHQKGMYQTAPEGTYDTFEAFIRYYCEDGRGWAPDIGWMHHGRDRGIGHMSQCFLELYTASKRNLWAASKDIGVFIEQNLLVDRWVRLETLHDDLISALEAAGHDPTPVQNEPKHENQGPHRAPIASYYTDELRSLVYERDHLLFESFGYGPKLPGA